jgi:hypothetical protein
MQTSDRDDSDSEASDSKASDSVLLTGEAIIGGLQSSASWAEDIVRYPESPTVVGGRHFKAVLA